MIEEQAKVVAVVDNKVRLELMRQQGCHGCTLASGCGVGSLGRLLGFRGFRIELENTLGAELGDRIVVAIPERAMLLASTLIYLLPLATMFLAGGVIAALGMSDGWVTTAALSGLASGIWLSGRLSRFSFGKALQPRMLRQVRQPRTMPPGFSASGRLT